MGPRKHSGRVSLLRGTEELYTRHHTGIACEVIPGHSLPLSGRRVLVTRPGPRADEFADKLSARGALPILAPVLAIQPPDDAGAALRAVERLCDYDWLVFTSAHGVDAFFERLTHLSRDARYVGATQIAAIGPATQRRLEQYGLRADVTPAEFVGEAVARALIDRAKPNARVLIYRAQAARDVLPRMLADAGLRPTAVAAYRSATVRDDDFARKVRDADTLTFTSAGCVRAFVELIGNARGARAAARTKTIACIGPIAADAARYAGLSVDVVADAYTTDGLIEALEAHATSQA